MTGLAAPASAPREPAVCNAPGTPAAAPDADAESVATRIAASDARTASRSEEAVWVSDPAGDAAAVVGVEAILVVLYPVPPHTGTTPSLTHTGAPTTALWTHYVIATDIIQAW